MRRHTPLLPSPTPQGPPAATAPPDAPAELTDAQLLACYRLLAAAAARRRARVGLGACPRGEQEAEHG